MTAPAIIIDWARGRMMPSRAVLTRASSGWERQASGIWRERPAGTARLWHDSGRCLGVLLEPSVTNLVTNSRLSGGTSGVIGSGGAAPPNTYFYPTLPDGNVTVTVTPNQVMSGIPGVAFRFQRSGSESTTYTPLYAFQGNAATTPAAPNERWQGRVWCALTSGSIPSGVNIGLRLQARDSSGATLLHESFSAVTGLTAQPAQFVNNWVLPSTSTIGSVFEVAVLTFPANTACDFTLFFGAAELKRTPVVDDASFITHSGTPAQVTRAEDSTSIHLSDYGLATTNTGTLLIAGRARTWWGSTAQRLVQIDDGSDTNRVTIERTTSQTIRADAVVSGTSQGSATTSATVAADTLFRAAVAYAPGDLALVLDGATPVTAAPASIASTMGRLRMTGTGIIVERIAYWPVRLPNATLQSLTVP